MNKCWYILIEGKKEGPYDVMQLRHDSRITPETLVWREGFKNWVPIKNVPELKIVFQDELVATDDDEEKRKEDRKKLAKLAKNEVIALDYRNNHPEFFWIIIIVLAACYALYKIYWRQ